MAIKALAIPLGISLIGGLASRLLSPTRKEAKSTPSPNYAQSGIGSVNWGIGTFVCSPHLIARTKVKGPSKGKSGGKKGRKGSTASAVYLICTGPINGVSRVMFNGKIVYDKRFGQNRDLLTGLCNRWAVLDGTQTTADPLYTAITGAGNSSTLNGWALLIIDTLNLKDTGNELPQVEVEVIRYPAKGFESIPSIEKIQSSPNFLSYSAVTLATVPSGLNQASVGQIQSIGPYFAIDTTSSIDIPGDTIRWLQSNLEIPPFGLSTFSIGTLTLINSGWIMSYRTALAQNGYYYYDDGEGYVNGVQSGPSYDHSLSSTVLIQVTLTRNTPSAGSNTFKITAGLLYIQHRNNFISTPTPLQVTGVTTVLGTTLINDSSTAYDIESLSETSSSLTVNLQAATPPPYLSKRIEFLLPRSMVIGQRPTAYKGHEFLINTAANLPDLGAPFSFFLRQGGISYFPSEGGILEGKALIDLHGVWRDARGSIIDGPNIAVDCQIGVCFNVVVVSGSLPSSPSFTIDFDIVVNVLTQGYTNTRSAAKVSSYYSPVNKTVVLKVSQCFDGKERIYSYETADPVYGAYIQYSPGSIPNLSGDSADESNGQLFLVTSLANIALTAPVPELGTWYDRGLEVSPSLWEYARPLEIEPIITFDEITGPAELGFPSLFGITPAPYTESITSTLDALALHNEPLNLSQVIDQLAIDFPDTVGQWVGGATYFDPRPSGQPEFYGWLLEGETELFDAFVKLCLFLGVDVVDNYGVIALIANPTRSLFSVPDEWISRQLDQDTGAEIPYYTLTEMPPTESPDEVRVTFRDAGRDGEESLAFFRSPYTKETNNVETFSAPVSMAYVTANRLALDLWVRATQRGASYKLRLNSRAYGTVSVGGYIQIPLHSSVTPKERPISLDDQGYTIDKTLTLLVTEITIDEQFNLEVKGSEAIISETVAYDSPTFVIPDDGIPSDVYLQALSPLLPIYDGNVTSMLQRFYQGTPSLIGRSAFPVGGAYNSTNGGAYEVFDSSAPTDQLRRGTLASVAPLRGVVDDASLITATGATDEGWSSVSDALFLQGQGTYLLINGELIRAKNATFAAGVWTFSGLIRGICGTLISSSGTYSLVYPSRCKAIFDQPGSLGIARTLKVVSDLQEFDASPVVPFTQSGLTATPYSVSQIQSNTQPDSSRVVTWVGHSLGNSKQINGSQATNIGIGPSFTLEVLGGSSPLAVTTGSQEYLLSLATLTSLFSNPADPVNIRIRQNGDYLLSGPWVNATV